jgi:hypothetical protein
MTTKENISSTSLSNFSIHSKPKSINFDCDFKFNDTHVEQRSKSVRLTTMNTSKLYRQDRIEGESDCDEEDSDEPSNRSFRTVSSKTTKQKSYSIANLNHANLKDSNNNSIDYDVDEDEDDNEEHDRAKSELDGRQSGIKYNSVYSINTIQLNGKTKTKSNKKVIRSLLKLIRPSVKKRNKTNKFVESDQQAQQQENRKSQYVSKSTFNLNTNSLAKDEDDEEDDDNSRAESIKQKVSKHVKKLNSSKSVSVLNEPREDENHNYFQSEFNFEYGERTNGDYGTTTTRKSLTPTIKTKKTSKSQLYRNNSINELNQFKAAKKEKPKSKSHMSKASRAFSMINSSSSGASSLKLKNLNQSMKSSNLNHSIVTTSSDYANNKRNSICSKELTWYKWEELDNYYKVLGKFRHFFFFQPYFTILYSLFNVLAKSLLLSPRQNKIISLTKTV